MIDEFGIAGFLKAEEQAILKGSYNHTVIATGGSVVYSSKAMAHLKKGAVVIYLKVDIGTLQKRINNIATRGIAMSRNQTLNDIYLERTPLYEQYADIIIDCSDKDVEGAVESILGSLNPSNP